mmetsp:Transcript_1243/g.1450  ORF Transcript_1243/g.1450 Transcript_1243/m.1450 type:complete len:207 (-) Transcript_1243:21-641(-)
MNSNTLADGLIDRVLNVEIFQGVVTGVQHTEDTDYSIVVDLIVTEVEGEQLVVGEQQLSDHHGSVRLYFVHVQVQVLEVKAFLEVVSQELGAITLDLVALQVESEQARGLANEIGEGLGSFIRYFVVTQINVLDINGKRVERRAEGNESRVVNAVVEVVLVVSLDDDLEGLVVFHGLFQVLHESIMGVDVDLVALLLVEESDFLLV